jgi:hypothetical protein
MSNVTQRAHSRLVDMALRYCAADRSDPFAFNRAMTHIRNGIATLARLDGEPACYEAEQYKEERHDPLLGPYTVTAYKNMKRP